MEAQARKCPLLAGQSSTPADTGYHVIELLDSDEEPADAIQDARQLSNMSGTAVPGQELHIPLAPCQTHVASQRQHLCKPTVATQGGGATASVAAAPAAPPPPADASPPAAHALPALQLEATTADLHTSSMQLPSIPAHRDWQLHPAPAIQLSAAAAGLTTGAAQVVRMGEGLPDPGDVQVQGPAPTALHSPAMPTAAQQCAQVVGGRADNQPTNAERTLQQGSPKCRPSTAIGGAPVMPAAIDSDNSTAGVLPAQVPPAAALHGPAMCQGPQQRVHVAGDSAGHQAINVQRTLQQGSPEDMPSTATGDAPRVPAVNHSDDPGGNDGPGSRVQSAAVAAGVVPEWVNDSPTSLTLLVPMSSQTAGQIISVRLQLGGVLLHPDCTQRWTYKYRFHQQMMAVCIKAGSVALVEGAQLQPCTLLRQSGLPETYSLVIHAAWPLAPPGQPGAISQEMYQAHRDGDPPTIYFTRGQPSSIILRASSMVAMQLAPAGETRRTSVHIMAAFARDGELIPLQQPVEVQSRSGHIKGWMGRALIVKNTTPVKCCRWLPARGDQAATHLEGPIGGAGGHSDAGGSAANASGSGDVQEPLEFAPGLLVIYLQSNDPEHSTSDGTEIEHQQPLLPPGLADVQGVSIPARACGAKQSNTGQDQPQQQQPRHMHQPVLLPQPSRPQPPLPSPPASASALSLSVPGNAHKRTAVISRDRGFLNTQCSDGPAVAKLGAQAEKPRTATERHHQSTGCQVQHHAQAYRQPQGQDVGDENVADPAQPLKRSRLGAGSDGAVNRVKTRVQHDDNGSPGQDAPAAGTAGPSRDVGMDSRQSPASQLKHWPPAPHVQPAPVSTQPPDVHTPQVPVRSGPAPAAAPAPGGAPCPPPTTHAPPAASARAPAPTAPLPQLPDFSSLDDVVPWKGRHAQMGVLLQLGRAVRPQSLGELVDRLQEIEAEQLWAFMAQHYQPVKQLQAVGGDEAVVRAQASKLLDRILAGGAAH